MITIFGFDRLAYILLFANLIHILNRLSYVENKTISMLVIMRNGLIQPVTRKYKKITNNIHTIYVLINCILYILDIYICRQLSNLRSMKKKFDETDGSMSLMSLRLFFCLHGHHKVHCVSLYQRILTNNTIQNKT